MSRVSRSLCDGLDGRVLVRTRMSNRGFDVVRIARRLITVDQRAAEEGDE
jgi:hypothetical protein